MTEKELSEAIREKQTEINHLLQIAGGKQIYVEVDSHKEMQVGWFERTYIDIKLYKAI